MMSVNIYIYIYIYIVNIGGADDFGDVETEGIYKNVYLYISYIA